MSDISKYLILDEERNAVDYLKHSYIFLQQVNNDLYALKWFIIAFHGALYSFMLLALQKVDSNQIYQEEKKKQNEKEKTPMEEFEAQKVLNFFDAYKLLKKSENMGGSPFIATPTIDRAMELLNNELRNQILHFKPMVSAYEPWYPARVCITLTPLLMVCISSSLNGQRKLDAEKTVGEINLLLKTHAD